MLEIIVLIALIVIGYMAVTGARDRHLREFSGTTPRAAEPPVKIEITQSMNQTFGQPTVVNADEVIWED